MELEAVAMLDEWLDNHVSEWYRQEPLGQHWARIAKVGEEYGEAVAAFIGHTGQNPRKGFTHTRRDVLDELVDVYITAILAIQHFTKDTAVTEQIISERWEYRKKAAKLSYVNHEATGNSSST